MPGLLSEFIESGRLRDAAQCDLPVRRRGKRVGVPEAPIFTSEEGIRYLIRHHGYTSVLYALARVLEHELDTTEMGKAK